MKKILPFILAIAMTMTAFSQEEPASDNDLSIRSNEIKLNALYLVIGSFDFTYEYLINEESGVGVNAFIPFDEDIKDDINYYISPYYRLYFGKKYAAGFFLEGFGMLNSYNEFQSINVNDPGDIFVRTTESKTNFALGVGLGGKWMTNSGFVGEINFGIGRNLFDTEDEDFEFVAKIGISVGYRF
ncbi:DUF3575 domain-containing protein [Winogradskyella tangerina]|uniref:DUF3575 domain-containing protein n=1 Tax=Winogradskyella tangerina TaxID=2023240 RepID=UPI000DBE5F85|nr:DUF3575 domain-containing protein [Winogradskyella tangerina]